MLDPLRDAVKERRLVQQEQGGRAQRSGPRRGWRRNGRRRRHEGEGEEEVPVRAILAHDLQGCVGQFVVVVVGGVRVFEAMCVWGGEAM